MIKNELAVRVRADDTIDSTVRRMARDARRVRHVGIAVVLDEAERVIGVVTDGDVRRAYATDVAFSEPVRRIMSADPVTVPAALPIEAVPAEVLRRIRRGGRLKADIVPHVLVTDPQGRLVGIYDALTLFAHTEHRRQGVAVYGRGKVALATAAALSDHGHTVVSVDLTMLPDQTAESDPVHLLAADGAAGVSAESRIEAAREAASAIGRRLRAGDLVMVCASLPIGTTREVVRPVLEKVSGLRAGEDFALAVTSEHFDQSASSADLRHLPRIVGGLTLRCAARAKAFWNAITPFIVAAPSLEGAELVQTASRQFHDLSLTFANHIALEADRYNIDMFALATAVKQGDPYATIQLPGPCLGALADHPAPSLPVDAFVAETGERIAAYPAQMAARFAQRRGVSPSVLNILVLGLAPQGEADQGSWRYSSAMITVRALTAMGVQLRVFDAAMPAAQLSAAGLAAVTDMKMAVADSDVVLILNGDRRHVEWNVAAPRSAHGRLIFDGCGLLDRNKIESIAGVTYATLGYMTPPRFAIIACDSGFGHVRRCALIAAALRERGADCDLFVPREATLRLDAPTIEFRTHSSPAGWRMGARETVAWPERLPDLDRYDYVLADSLPEILDRRSDAILIGHFLWTHVLPDVDAAHVSHVSALLDRHRPQMYGTGLLASDRLKAACRYTDVGFFVASEQDQLPTDRDELLVSSGLGAEPSALVPLKQAVAALAALEAPPAPFKLVHVEPGLLPNTPPRWMIPASYEPAMYRRLAAAILRPGAGTVTDCVARSVWMVWPQSSDHDEILHNANTIAAHQLGAIATSPEAAIRMVCDFARDGGRVAELRARCAALPFDAAATLAGLLLNGVHSGSDAANVNRAA